MAENRRLAAIMFTDLVGFTALAQADESHALRLLERHRQLLRPVFVRHGGREVKTIGDSFLVEFGSALEATRAAIEAQQALRIHNSSADDRSRIHLRIGVHLGDVVHQGPDVIGDAVNIASRIEPLADPGGICVSQQVFDQVENKVELRFVRLSVGELKNVKTPVGVYKVELPGSDAARGTPSLSGHRMAVLPMENLGNDPQNEFLADGLTDELILALSKVPGFHVIARTSVMRYKGTTKSVGEIARELGVTSLLEGGVQRHGKRLRVTAKLADATTEEPLWSEAYDRDLADVFALEADIARRIAGALKVELVREGGIGVPRRRPADPEVVTRYLRGRYFWNKRTEEALTQAVSEFKHAIARDPKFAPAFAGLADAQSSRALLEFVRPRAAFPAAKRAAERAISLDPASAEAHTAIGVVRFQYDRDWAGAEAEMRKAIELNPNYAAGHHMYADLLKAMGRLDEALTEIRTAQELDPLSLAINTGVGHVLYLSRKYDDAIEQYRKTLELDPNFVQAHLWFGRPYLEKGQFAEAIAELEQAVALSSGSTISLAVLGHAYASAGQRGEAEKILARLRERARGTYVPSYWIGLIYTGLGDLDRAFDWFGRAYRERSSWLAWAKVEPRFDVLRSDPRFSSLLRRMNLPIDSAGPRTVARRRPRSARHRPKVRTRSKR